MNNFYKFVVNKISKKHNYLFYNVEYSVPHVSVSVTII